MGCRGCRFVNAASPVVSIPYDSYIKGTVIGILPINALSVKVSVGALVSLYPKYVCVITINVAVLYFGVRVLLSLV
jgi:hypothetical protein